MSHFMRKIGRSVKVTRYIAAVMVSVSAKSLRVVTGEIVMLNPVHDVTLAPIPEGYEVTSTDGTILQPSRGFWVTLETFDPYHCLVDGDFEFLRG